MAHIRQQPKATKGRAVDTSFTPNPQQAAAIAHTHGPAAFIAAAGTGKTAILVQRLVRLIAEERIAPGSILCVTFTRAAAEEMKKRALKALKAHGKAATDLKDLHVVTFHGLGHLMLREKLQWKPQELNQRLLSGDPRQWLAEDILRPWRSDRTRGMNWNIDVAQALGAVDRAKEALIAMEDSAEFFARDLLVDSALAARYQEFFTCYEETKKQKKLYDLADLIYVPLGLLESSPKFRKSWQGRYQHLQVDETQDTNPAQYRLIQHLAEPHQNVVIVGDPDQAIYNFRGASPEASILSFKQMYPTGRIYRIEENYRSTPQILDAANRIISHNPTTPGFEKTLRPTLPDGPEVVVTAYQDQEREAEGIAAHIAGLAREWQAEKSPLSFRDIFVLSRTNHHLASLELVLARLRIPYRTLGGSSFFKRKTTRDMLAYLALIEGMRVHRDYVASQHSPEPQKWDDVFTPVFSGEQNAAFRVVAHIPSQAYFAQTGKASHRFTASFYSVITNYAAGRPVLQFCEEQGYRIPAEYQPGMRDFVALIKTVSERCHNHPAEAIRLIRALAYDTHLKHRDTRQEDEESEDESAAPANADDKQVEARFEELDELIQIAQRHRTIRHFLQALTQLKEQSEDTRKQKRDCVTLLTVHKSKGLEQKVVFVMGLTEGIFPHRRSYTLDEDGGAVVSGIPEERRLAYVAFTRAQHLLCLSTILRYRGGEATPSRFIAEAGLEPRDEAGVLNPFLARRPKATPAEPQIIAPALFE